MGIAGAILPAAGRFVVIPGIIVAVYLVTIVVLARPGTVTVTQRVQSVTT